MQSNARAQGLEIGSGLASRLAELRQMRREGRLNEEQFFTLTRQAREFANISLDKLRGELRRTANEGVISALGGERGRTDGGMLRRIQGNISNALNVGAIDQEQAQQIRQAVNIARQSRGQSGDRALVRMLRSGNANPFLADVLSQSGRGDLVNLANLSGGSAGAMRNAELAAIEAENSAMATLPAKLDNTLSNGFNAMVQRLDTLIAVTQGVAGAVDRPNLTVQGSVSDAAMLWNQIGNKSIRAANL